MSLEERDKELVAIGASIGALCGPCIDHHIPAGRKAGLTEPELARAVQVAEETHRIAAELLFRRSRGLLPGAGPSAGALPTTRSTSRLDELVALGASIGANCHPLLEQRIADALAHGRDPGQVRSAIKMAEIVQRHAAEITAGKAAAAMAAVGSQPAVV